jgi:hypothetical protein
MNVSLYTILWYTSLLYYHSTTRYNFVCLKETCKISPLEELVYFKLTLYRYSLRGNLYYYNIDLLYENEFLKAIWQAFDAISYENFISSKTIPVNLWELLGGGAPTKSVLLLPTMLMTK